MFLCPSTFWDLTSLSEVDLSGNKVRLYCNYGFGDMGNTGSLRKVDLLSSNIQLFTGIDRALSLEELHMDDACFFSRLDAELYKLENLKASHMQFLGLSGKIPEGIQVLKNLMELK